LTGYVIRRVLLNIVVIWLVATFVFIAMRVLPGDFAAQQVSNAFLAGGGCASTPEEQLQEARRRLGLDKPVPVQYVYFMGDILSGDFGNSFQTGRPAIRMVGDALPYSLQLGVMALLIAIVIAIPVGTISAIRQDTLIDDGLRLFAILGLAAPSFFTATLGTLLVLKLDWWELDIVGHPGIWESPLRSIQLFLVPALAAGIASGAVIMRLLRSQLLDVLRQDYVRTARAKGLRERAIVVRHVLRNGFIPVITVLGFLIGSMFSGNVILESMFNIPGMGQRLLQAITIRDVPVAQTMTLLIATGLVMVNLLVDLTYFLVDPRVTVGRAGS
jgi:peptide/nickel transport system permease protein